MYQNSEVEKEIRDRWIRTFADFLFLTAAKLKEMSGYEFMSFIHTRFHVLLSPGTIYPMLASLERKGLVQSNLFNRKRMYKTTNNGIQVAKFLFEEYSTLSGQLQNLWVSLSASLITNGSHIKDSFKDL